MMIVMDGPLMERITDKLLDLQGEENHDLRLLEQQLSEVEKGIENMLNAIQAGIITESTKQRLSDLESEKRDLEERITENRIQHPALTREQIAFFLAQFQHTDINDEEEKQRLIDSFVNAVYVYEDKIVLIFNYKGGTKAVNLNDINSSDLETSGPPKITTPFGVVIFLLRRGMIRFPCAVALSGRPGESGRAGGSGFHLHREPKAGREIPSRPSALSRCHSAGAVSAAGSAAASRGRASSSALLWSTQAA